MEEILAPEKKLLKNSKEGINFHLKLTILPASVHVMNIYLELK